MTWNPSVRVAPIVVTARPTPHLETAKMKETEGAAVAAVAMELARRANRRRIAQLGMGDGYASAWVVRGRMDTANRWTF